LVLVYIDYVYDVYSCVNIHIYTHTFTDTHIYIYIHIDSYLRMYIYIYIYISLNIHIHLHIAFFFSGYPPIQVLTSFLHPGFSGTIGAVEAAEGGGVSGLHLQHSHQQFVCEPRSGTPGLWSRFRLGMELGI